MQIIKPSWLSTLNSCAGWLATLAPLSLTLFAYERTLVPLYGAGPTRYHLSAFVFTAIVLAGLEFEHLSTSASCLPLIALLSIAPSTSYWTAVHTARLGEPLWGLVVTHSVVMFPIVYGFAKIAIDFELCSPIAFDSPYRASTISSRLVKCGVSYLIIRILGHLWSTSSMESISDITIFFLLSWAALVVWVTRYWLRTPRSTYFAPVVLVAGLILSQILQSRLRPLFRKAPFTHPSYPLQILSSKQSSTGLIVVGEGVLHRDDKNAVRYLRASHSILGGNWAGKTTDTTKNTPVSADTKRTSLGDSIYSTFVLQEAALLVNNTGKEKWNKALVIGLGTGVSAAAFIQHNLSTTVIEIDPAVYHAAREFFNMPDPGAGNVFLEDARRWIKRRRRLLEHSERLDRLLFDIVVHDCFSGGAVPEHLFTIQFWDDLKYLMHKNGVVVVNFAGNVKSDASQAILNTLEKSFTHCRAFHDSFEDLPAEDYHKKFVNMVFFCTLSPRLLTFRQSSEADYLNSPLRKHILTSLRTREIDTSLIRAGPDTGIGSLVLTDEYNPLGKWQERQTNEHWKIMRQVFPDVFWETY